MTYFPPQSIVCLFLMVLISHSTLSKEHFSWPAGKKAAVSLAYDDALPSQLNNAIPHLNKYGLKATFYLTISSISFQNRKEEWQSVAKSGHELGNHTINHACSRSLPNREWVSPNNDLDLKTVSELVAEVEQVNRILYELDNETVRTFSVPCADHLAGGSNYVESLHSLFAGIKGTMGGVARTIADIEVTNVNVFSPSNISGNELIEYVKQAQHYGTLANITFHGIGGDHLSISNQAHQQLLAYLANNADIYWVDTFKNISEYITKQRKLSSNGNKLNDDF